MAEACVWSNYPASPPGSIHGRKLNTGCLVPGGDINEFVMAALFDDALVGFRPGDGEAMSTREFAAKGSIFPDRAFITLNDTLDATRTFLKEFFLQ
jgi:hypothetical protein